MHRINHKMGVPIRGSIQSRTAYLELEVVQSDRVAVFNEAGSDGTADTLRASGDDSDRHVGWWYVVKKAG
jgi:hypothetical protein